MHSESVNVLLYQPSDGEVINDRLIKSPLDTIANNTTLRVTLAYDGKSNVAVDIYKTSVLGNIDVLLETIEFDSSLRDIDGTTVRFVYDVCIPAGSYAVVLVARSQTTSAEPVIGLRSIELMDGSNCVYSSQGESLIAVV
jgi:hypothetical protein